MALNPEAAERGRILVVDDESSIAELLSTALRYMGYEVAAARSGAAALQQASAVSPDLIVLDAARHRRFRGMPPAARGRGLPRSD